VVLGFFKWSLFFCWWLGVFALNGVDTRKIIEWRCGGVLIALKPLRRFLLFGVCVLLLDAR
jgi:hypothetical protein